MNTNFLVNILKPINLNHTGIVLKQQTVTLLTNIQEQYMKVNA